MGDFTNSCKEKPARPFASKPLFSMYSVYKYLLLLASERAHNIAEAKTFQDVGKS